MNLNCHFPNYPYYIFDNLDMFHKMVVKKVEETKGEDKLEVLKAMEEAVKEVVVMVVA